MNPIRVTPNSPQVSVIDLFCGTGAISYGLSAHNPNFVTVAGIDIDNAACQTAAANHPKALIINDSISNIPPSQIQSKIDLSAPLIIVGGPPCQGFSSIRPSRGTNLEDPRNSLYRDFIHYVAKLRPLAFLMENVVGLVNASGGDLLADIIVSLKKQQYTVDWRILNSANFGVPQKRERFFLIGIDKKVLPEAQIRFPEPTHWFKGRVIGTRHKANYVTQTTGGLPPVTVWDAISDLPSLKSGETSTRYKHPPLNAFQKSRRSLSPRTLRLHEAARHSPKILQIIAHSGSNINALPPGLVSSGYSSCYSRLEADQPSTTITVKFTSPASSKCIHPFDNRAITPREAARIQGFNDEFVFKGPKTAIASQIGNAVPPLFGKAFGPIFDQIVSSFLKSNP
jgi:DNA (cytosine-5)-methyltransferase 1